MSVSTIALRGSLLRLGAASLGLAAAGALIIQGSEAAFTASTDNNGNAVSSGTVVLTDDSTTAMFNVGGLNGGQTVTRCINVTYAGSLSADIRLHAGVVDSATSDLVSSVKGELAPGLATTIEVGTGAAGGASFGCSGFTSGVTKFSGDSLFAFGKNHHTYATGLSGFDNAAKDSTKSYRVTMVVSNDSTYQGVKASVDLTWEAQGKNDNADASTTNDS